MVKRSFGWSEVGSVINCALRESVGFDEKGNVTEWKTLETVSFDTDEIQDYECRRRSFMYGIKKIIQDRNSEKTLTPEEKLAGYRATFADLKVSFFKTRVNAKAKRPDTFRLAYAAMLKFESEGKPVDTLVLATAISKKTDSEAIALYTTLASEGWIGKADLKLQTIESVEI